MRLLLAIGLSFTLTTLTFGDEKSNPVDDFGLPKPPVAAPVPDPIAAPIDNFRPPKRPVDDLGSDPQSGAPLFKEGVKADATEWHPRLVILLKANDNAPQSKVVMVRQKSQSETSSFPGPPGESVTSRDVEVKTLKVLPGDFFSLYCDTVTLGIAQVGDTSTYHLECNSRVRICSEGLFVDADSASFKDGKCELVNAMISSGVVTATAKQLTLTIPIHGVSTSSFGRPVPKSPHTLNMIAPPSTEARFFAADAPRPEPIPTESGSDASPADGAFTRPPYNR